MDTRTQGEPGYYVWEVEGQAVTVWLHLDVVDRLAQEIVRGLGAVPKRGAEVGGILLGAIEPGGRTIVRIEDFEAVPCDYKRGPSFLLTESDSLAFDDACERWHPESGQEIYAVGYYRSHTRDGAVSLGPEDLEILDQYFTAPDHIALLAKPFATKASLAGFFLREDGVFPDVTRLEFPFRRRDLTSEDAPPSRPLGERRPRVRQMRAEETRAEEETSPREARAGWGDPRTSVPADAASEAAGAPPAKPRLRGGWIWIPLSFVFLLLGVLLGFQSALTMGNKSSTAVPADFSLGLLVTRADENLAVKWNRDAPAVRTAQKGLLEIEDGGYAKPVDLDQAHLQGGSIIYRNSTSNVHFRLIVYLNGRLTVTENIEWRQ